MRLHQDIRHDLLTALELEADDSLGALGFGRRKGTTEYKRQKKDATHAIVFVTDLFPRYEPDAEAHIHPKMRVAMPVVSERALALVAGDEMLLANAPEVILNQPIEFAAPKEQRVRWFAAGRQQFKQRIRDITAFTQAWTVPLLDELDSPESLARVYSRKDDRIMMQKHWYLYVVAAYDLMGMPEKACEVLEMELGAPGLRSRFSVAFRTLGLEGK
jgi:hypothetical protein